MLNFVNVCAYSPGMNFKSLKTLKLRYPNSHDLVRIAQWTTLQRLDIKFPEHEREWHQVGL